MSNLAALKPWRWLAVPLLGVAAYALGHCTGTSSAHDALAIQQAEAALAQGKAYRLQLAKLGAIAQVAKDSAREYERRFSQRGALIRQLDTALSRATMARDTIPILLQQNLSLRGQVSDLQQANGSLQSALRAAEAQSVLAQARADSLESHLRSTLQVAECRWDLLIMHPRCPSRIAVAVIGLGVGAVGALVVHR